ncbi:MAG TPA: AtpZ/AtpI family protein [Candidatus Faecalicoccus intestinipullorum]|nr:AtpZ/AtpI family protein [Candidatus Faecalicoccus intestinipullorum]
MKPLTFSGVLLVNILVSVWIGYQLDQWLHTLPLFVMAGLMYSVIGSIYLLIRKDKKHE